MYVYHSDTEEEEDLTDIPNLARPYDSDSENSDYLNDSFCVPDSEIEKPLSDVEIEAMHEISHVTIEGMASCYRGPAATNSVAPAGNQDAANAFATVDKYLKRSNARFAFG